MQVWNWWMLASGSSAPAPADQEGLEACRRRPRLSAAANSIGWMRDVEAGLLGHLLDDLAHPPLPGACSDRQLEGVAAGAAPRRPGASWRARRRASGTSGSCRRTGSPARSGVQSGRVLAFPDHLVQRLAVDRQLERLAHARVVGQRRAEVAGRGRWLPVLVPQVDVERRSSRSPARWRPRTCPPSSGSRRAVGFTRCMKSMSPERRLATRTLSSGDDPEDEPVELGLAPGRSSGSTSPARCGPGPRAPTNAHGPTQTGAVPNLSSSFRAWVGDTGMPARSARMAMIGENGAFRRSRTVGGSTTSTSSTSVQLAPAVRALHLPVPVERVLHRLGVQRRAVVELHARRGA